jgi:hypothetical protein
MMAFNFKTMKSSKKAQELFDKHGFEVSNSIIDSLLDEHQKEFNQDMIDYYLDVKNDLKSILYGVPV